DRRPRRGLRGPGDQTDPGRGGRGDAGAGAPRPHALLLRGPDPGRDRPGARGDREPGLPDPHQGDPPAALPPPRTRTGPGRVIPGARPPSWSTLAPLRRTGFDPTPVLGRIGPGNRHEFFRERVRSLFPQVRWPAPGEEE